MATTKEQWKTAFDLLSKFERCLIKPEKFKMYSSYLILFESI